jgi:hypothetical protein
MVMKNERIEKKEENPEKKIIIYIDLARNTNGKSLQTTESELNSTPSSCALYTVTRCNMLVNEKSVVCLIAECLKG